MWTDETTVDRGRVEMRAQGVPGDCSHYMSVGSGFPGSTAFCLFLGGRCVLPEKQDHVVPLGGCFLTFVTSWPFRK